VLLLVAQGLLPAAIVYLTRALVDSLVAAVGAGVGPAGARATIVLAAIMAAALLATEVLRAAVRWVRAAQAERTRDHISTLVHERALALDLSYFESPEYFDQLHHIRTDVQHRPAALMESVGGLAQNTLTLVAMLAVLLRFGVWLPLLLCISTVPALAVVLRYAVREYLWRQAAITDERRAYYVDWVLTSRESAAELRLFQLGDRFRALFAELRARLRRGRLDLARHEGLAGLAAAAIALITTGVALTWMVWRALARTVTLGEVAMFYQAFAQGQQLMRSLLDNVGQIYGNSLFLGNLFAFLELEPAVADPRLPAAAPARLEHGLRFRNVTFRYPGTERPVLEHLDLELPAGRVVAVVGPNGAGKSTLIKLLCRLYDPERGVVEADSADLRSLPLAAVRRLYTVLLQEPARFAATFRDNVAFGDVARPGTDVEVLPAVRAAGAEDAARRLPAGLDTMLGRWFAGGAELSVGEWQRVALARACFRDAPVILLDEPTSAMDSWAENEWMERFLRLAAGRTTLLITHRFTTAMRADVIHVMREGRIVESGSHAELLRGGGRYAQSWSAQARQAAGAPERRP
jgi:ATP-binding cassette subfamily B protein